MLFYGFILLIPLFAVLFLFYMFMSRKSDNPGMGGNADVIRPPKPMARPTGREV